MSRGARVKGRKWRERGYEYILDLLDDPDVIEPIKFLRSREIVHFQRFGESLGLVRDYLDSKRTFTFEKNSALI